MTEAKTNMAFGHFRRGERFRVDLSDVYVQGLIRGGYVTLIEEGTDAASMDSTSDPAGPGQFPGAGVASGAVQEEEALDGARETEPGEGDHHGA